MLPHNLMEGGIPLKRSANGNRNGILLNRIMFPFVSVKKILIVPFPFVSVKTNIKSSVRIIFLLMALCFRVNP